MPPTKAKLFSLPVDLCRKLEEAEGTQVSHVVAALRIYFGTQEAPKPPETPVEAPRRLEVNYTDRVAELSRTLPPATAARIAGLEAGR